MSGHENSSMSAVRRASRSIRLDPQWHRYGSAAQSPDLFRAIWAQAALRREYGLILAFGASVFESLVRGQEKH
ncbi:hypothetical protein EN873_07030 [bacterium M00.F.Ca.ET.230.01.1.1]|nr:hypothetical protein EN873_07030 [bacterium M00.F.Ca.ET.230.01.1.1]